MWYQSSLLNGLLEVDIDILNMMIIICFFAMTFLGFHLIPLVLLPLFGLLESITKC